MQELAEEKPKGAQAQADTPARVGPQPEKPLELPAPRGKAKD